jgi:hypothetical protein
MSKMKKTKRRSGIVRSKSGGYRIVGGKGTVHIESVKTPDGQEVWRITSGDRIVNLITSSTSTAIMDDAVRIYSPALERLAKR